MVEEVVHYISFQTNSKKKYIELGKQQARQKNLIRTKY
jgi:hypothetical protein